MTRRSIGIGLLMALAVNLWPAYASMIVNSSRVDYAHLSLAFLIPFLLLLALNQLLGRVDRGLVPAELIVICCIGTVAATMQGEWLSGYLVSTITAPIYFATPENRWGEVLLSRIPRWTVLSDHKAATGFHESLAGTGGSIPWSAWAPPLFWWTTLLGSLMGANLCLMVVMRKQWMEHERLPFPIASALLELTGTEDNVDSLRTLSRNRLFRTGGAVTFGLIAWNVVSWFVTSWPSLPVLRQRSIRLGKGFPAILFVVHPMTIAFGYFTKSEVLLSIWVFHLVAVVQAGVFNRIGLDIGGADPWGSFHTAVGWQGFGGMVVFVFWGLWIGRSHLRDVIRKAMGRAPEIDDRDELLSYRMAVVGLLVCGAYILLFFRSAGMAWGPLVTFWFGTFVLYLGLARIIVESGLVFIRGPITAQAFTWHLFGSAGMDPASAIALGLTQAFFCDAKTFGITAAAHVPRLGAAIPHRGRRTMVPAVLLGCLLGAGAWILFAIYNGYHGLGAYNFGIIQFRGVGGSAAESWGLVANRLQRPFDTSWERIGFLGFGGAFTAVLIGLRYVLPSFSLHPIGFAIGASLILRSSASSIFMVWIAKTLILKFGSLDRYRRTAPLFLGLMVGHLLGIGLGVVVDTFWFHGAGHGLNRW